MLSLLLRVLFRAFHCFEISGQDDASPRAFVVELEMHVYAFACLLICLYYVFWHDSL